MIEELAHPEIEFLLLADRVEVINGKLYMMGGAWDRLHVGDFSQPSAFGLTVGVLVPWLGTNQDHPVTISIEDADGRKITPDLQARVHVVRPAHAIAGQSFRGMIAVNGFWKLPGPGSFRAVATLADGSAKHATFYVTAAATV